MFCVLFCFDVKNDEVYGNSVSRSSRPEVFYKNGVLRILQNSQETLAQVFSCEFCVISKSTLLYRTPLVTACEFPQNVEIISE